MKKTLYSQQHKKLIIIGAGPAGLTACMYAARANLKPLLITGKVFGGQILQAQVLENWPGISGNFSGGDFIYQLTQQIEKLSVKLVFEEIITVDFSSKPFQLCSNTNTYTSDSLILATGCKPKILPILNKFLGLGGVSYCATCDGYLYRGKNIVIVGGGNTALTEAIYLSNIVDKVYLVHYKPNFRASKVLINSLLKKVKEKKITIYLNYEITKIYTTQSNENEKDIIVGVGIQTTNTTVKKVIDLQISCIFIAIGTIPSTQIFNEYINLDKYGYIKIFLEHKFYTQTNVEGIFAAGDVTNINSRYKQAITAAASGCMAAMDCEKYLFGQKD